MRKNYLVNVNKQVKEFFVKSVDKITHKNVNVLVGDSIITTTNLAKKIVDRISSRIIEKFIVNGYIYLYCDDNCLYNYNPKDKTFKKVCECKGQPILTSVIINSEKNVLVIEENATYVAGQTVDVGTAVYGTVATTFKGKCFVAKDNLVYISHPINLATETMNVSPLNVLTLDKQWGNVLDLICFDYYLLIVCEKAFYKLKTNYSEEYSLEKVNMGNIEVMPKSLIVVGDRLYFITNQKICYYDDGVIKTENTIYDKYLNTFCDKAQAYKQYFILQVSVEEKKYILFFDTLTKQCFIIDSEGESLLGENCVYVLENRDLKIIDEGAYDQGEWESVPLTFNNNNKKAICEVSMYASQPCNLFISGDFGSKSFNVHQGCFVLKTNLISSVFNLRINIPNSHCCISDMSIKYRIMEG